MSEKVKHSWEVRSESLPAGREREHLWLKSDPAVGGKDADATDSRLARQTLSFVAALAAGLLRMRE